MVLYRIYRISIIKATSYNSYNSYTSYKDRHTPSMRRGVLLFLSVMLLVLNCQRLQDNLCSSQVVVTIEFYGILA